MCNPASFVVTKDRVFWSKRSDSHEYIIKEFDLCADGIDGPKIVRVEITPPNNNFRAPLEDWQLNIDEVVISCDLLPSWFNMDDVSRRTRSALKNWISKRIIDSNKIIHDEQAYVFGNSCVYAYETSFIISNDESNIEAYGRTLVHCKNQSKVRAYQRAEIICKDDCTIKSYDNSIIFGYGNCNIYSYDESIVTAYDNCTVYAYNRSFVRAYDDAKVFKYDQAIVDLVNNNDFYR